MGQWLRSILFTIYLFASVGIFGVVVVLSRVLGGAMSYRLARGWAVATLWLLKVLCRLDYRVDGTEHLPSEASVILIKHSSAWETIAQLTILPRQTWVLKRELLWVPIFGWVLMILKPIAINRGAGRSAVQQVVAQGRRRLAEGLWVVIFPEGTRVPAGESRRYGLGGALLAAAAGRPIVPVAHNAGEFWPRRGWLKRRGTIHVVIGPPIATSGKEPRQINAEVRAWIETQLEAMRRATS